MFPILIGFGSAALFGIFAYATYGFEGMSHFEWIRMTLLALVASGLLVFTINRKLPCLLCRLRKRLSIVDSLCERYAPCT